MSIELKRCPFCGGEAVFITQSTRPNRNNNIDLVFYIECSKCHTHLPQNYFISYRLDSKGDLVTTCDAREKAIKAWNKRMGE